MSDLGKRAGGMRTGKRLHEHLMGCEKKHRKHHDAGGPAAGPVPPSGGFRKGGHACRKAAGGTPAERLTRGESTGERGGANPSHELTRGESTHAAHGRHMKRAMGGAGKTRLGMI